MASINLKRFVDIDIVYHTQSTVSSTRDTVALLSTEGTSSTSATFSSYAEYLAATATSTTTITDSYAKIFFDNGGIKLYVVWGVTSGTLQSIIKNLDNKYIVVCYTGSYSDIKLAAQTFEADSTIYGINQKMLLGRTDSADTDVVKYFAVKYSSVVGAEMSIAAYLCQINVYDIGSIADYAFTKEILTYEDADDTVLAACLTNNMNVDMYLAGSCRNLGGNTKDGYDLVNAYILIILHQTLTDRLFNLLTEKISGAKGIAAIGTVMSQELSRYTASGYLSTDKIWTDNNLTITYNDFTYSIIKKGEQLLLGYKVVVLPYSSLTDEDKALRKTPPIYVVIADNYGIRAITVNGEVI